MSTEKPYGIDGPPGQAAGASKGEGGTPGAPSVTVLRATAPDEAEAAVAGAYLPHSIETLEPGRLSMLLTAARLGTTTAGRLGYGRRIRLVTEEARHIHVNTPLAGTAVSRVGRSAPHATTIGSAAAFPEGAPATMEWSSDAVQLCVMVPSSTLETELEGLLGHAVKTPLRLPFHMSLTTPEGRVWHSMANLIGRELDSPARLLERPRAGRQLERGLLDALILGHPHGYLDEIQRHARPAAPAAVARAVDLLHERPAEPWSSTVLARAIHLSVRSLQGGFHTHVGQPPMAYLRDLRLRGIHGDLVAATPGSTTVESVAYDWGMLHLGRFAAAYRREFGELPSRTLQRPPG
ncbi:AraC family transcriptional regulator [Pedococcus ginsenosidimutans]|uniref:AraC family transcriptional regulator n=1 Tax=Pedococcus ginsenosidimutans TaxID=490570 RepID=A0ABP8XV75_9MICO